MNIRTQVDSVGAVRWIRRAKTMARSIKKRTGVARAILDGYLLEGRRSGKNRLARVMDLPGRFVPFGHTGVAVGVPGASESWWPAWVESPTRAVTLERSAGDEGGPLEMSFEHPSGREIAAHFIGPPPDSTLRSLGMSTPQASADYVVQTRLVYPSADPVPSVNPDELLIDYSGVSALWVMVDAWGAGSADKFTMLINEQVIQSIFGFPVLRKEWSDWSTQQGENRVWATIVSPGKVAVAAWLSDGLPVGQAGSMGLMVYEAIEGEWELVFSHHLRHDQMPHELFEPHFRVDISGDPLVPQQRSYLRPGGLAMAHDGRKVILLSLMRHALDARGYTEVASYRELVVSGVLRVEMDLEVYGVAVEIDHVNTDAELFTGSTLITTNEVFVPGAISYPWAVGEWPVYCWMFFDSTALHEVIGFARAERTDAVGGMPSDPLPWYVHQYQDAAVRFAFRTTSWEDDEPVEQEAEMFTNEVGFNAMTAPGAPLTVTDYDPFYTGPLIVGMTDGGNIEIPMAFCGEGKYEMTLYRGDSEDRVIARFDIEEGTVTEVPLPDGATRPVSTCYAQERVLENEDGTVIPHRSVVTYRAAGATVVEVRSGDDVIAVDDDISRDYRIGMYYMGNPFASARYGKMEALV